MVQDGDTALMMASANGHTKVVELLVASGAAVEAQSEVRVRQQHEAAMPKVAPHPQV